MLCNNRKQKITFEKSNNSTQIPSKWSAPVASSTGVCRIVRGAFRSFDIYFAASQIGCHNAFASAGDSQWISSELPCFPQEIPQTTNDVKSAVLPLESPLVRRKVKKSIRNAQLTDQVARILQKRREEETRKRTQVPRVALGKKRFPLSLLSVGMQLMGRIIRVKPFGVWVDVGCYQNGLVHLKDLSSEWIESPLSHFSAGDTQRVTVKFVDTEKHILGLSLLPPLPVPLTALSASSLSSESRCPVASFSVEDRVGGYVKRITSLGCFLDIGATVDAFLHIRDADPSLYCKRSPYKDASDLFHRGMYFKQVFVSAVDISRQRIRVSTRSWEKELNLRLDFGLETREEQENYASTTDGILFDPSTLPCNENFKERPKAVGYFQAFGTRRMLPSSHREDPPLFSPSSSSSFPDRISSSSSSSSFPDRISSSSSSSSSFPDRISSSSSSSSSFPDRISSSSSSSSFPDRISSSSSSSSYGVSKTYSSPSSASTQISTPCMYTPPIHTSPPPSLEKRFPEEEDISFEEAVLKNLQRIAESEGKTFSSTPLNTATFLQNLDAWDADTEVAMTLLFNSKSDTWKSALKEKFEYSSMDVKRSHAMKRKKSTMTSSNKFVCPSQSFSSEISQSIDAPHENISLSYPHTLQNTEKNNEIIDDEGFHRMMIYQNDNILEENKMPSSVSSCENLTEDTKNSVSATDKEDLKIPILSNFPLFETFSDPNKENYPAVVSPGKINLNSNIWRSQRPYQDALTAFISEVDVDEEKTTTEERITEEKRIIADKLLNFTNKERVLDGTHSTLQRSSAMPSSSSSSWNSSTYLPSLLKRSAAHTENFMRGNVTISENSSSFTDTLQSPLAFDTENISSSSQFSGQEKHPLSQFEPKEEDLNVGKYLKLMAFENSRELLLPLRYDDFIQEIKASFPSLLSHSLVQGFTKCLQALENLNLTHFRYARGLLFWKGKERRIERVMGMVGKSWRMWFEEEMSLVLLRVEKALSMHEKGISDTLISLPSLSETIPMQEKLFLAKYVQNVLNHRLPDTVEDGNRWPAQYLQQHFSEIAQNVFSRNAMKSASFTLPSKYAFGSAPCQGTLLCTFMQMTKRKNISESFNKMFKSVHNSYWKTRKIEALLSDIRFQELLRHARIDTKFLELQSVDLEALENLPKMMLRQRAHSLNHRN
ncbi:S1 Rna binding domain-containing protein [Cardiosporidium cionae]|uniref:S1 Rna binding domain-containing protein n=1 Tax=Cardiosporidium cionae TaxID=476202 RepID=A0ABQ7JC22_9APIC|nr:S1 Rna binding domain-containing protein [Cardiosporidium cionae]|eukprot:KAF8821444.1 S1 Rna binding domain-containing protein [Cardiosporidium cionae]